jgi:thiol-disulfide isomerase/thioredoxin
MSFLTLSCTSSDKNKIEVPLSSKLYNNPIYSTQIPVNFLSKKPNEFLNEIIPDSSYIGYIDLFSFEKLNKFLADGTIEIDDLEQIQSRIYCLTGIDNNKQFLVVDVNQNNTFSDDKVYEFDINISSQTEGNSRLVDSIFKPFKMNVHKLRNNSLFKDDIFVQFFPNSNYFTYTNPDAETKLKQKLQLIVEFNDYSYGEFEIEDEIYKVGLTKYNDPEYEKFVFAKKNKHFPKQNYHRYSLKDTIKLKNKYFKIDTVTYNPKKLILNLLDSQEKIFSYRPGYKIRNYQIQSIDSVTTNLHQLSMDNKLLLIDFWGTWCAPCKELTPDLVKLNQKYGDKLNIVSLAYQQEVEPVKKYSIENNMDWFNGIIKGTPKTRNPKAKIIKELRINVFPTFILIDSELNIVYRMSPYGNSFDELVNFIDKYQK